MNKQLLVAAVAAGTMAVGLGVAVAGATGASTPACRSSQLQSHYDGQSGADGTIGDEWHFTNVGGTCQTIGFVGALNFGADGRPLPTAVHWEGAKSTIVLAHGQRASWVFYYANPSYSGCTPEAATRMIITPPNNTYPMLASRGVQSCGGVFNATSLSFAG